MDDGPDALDELDRPSLLCEEHEELDIRERDRADKTGEQEEETIPKFSGASIKLLIKIKGREEQPAGGLEGEPGEVQVVSENEKNDRELLSNKLGANNANSLGDKDVQKLSRTRRGKKRCEQAKDKKGPEDDRVTERVEEKECEGQMLAVPEMGSEGVLALPDLLAGQTASNCDPSDPASLNAGTELYCPLAPIPPLYSNEPQTQITPAPPQRHGTKRLQSPLPSHTLPPPAQPPMEMAITQVFAMRRSIRFSMRGRGRALTIPLLSSLDGEEPVDPALLPPAPKKKTRTLYTTDQLEHLENLFQEDHYPDAEKRKVIAASVGVTPQRIMVWFQNRRAKGRKLERSTGGNKQSRAGCSVTNQHTNPSLMTRVPLPNNGTGSMPCHTASIAPLHPFAAPPLPISSTQTLPSYGALLASLTSPSLPGMRDVVQNQTSCHGASLEYSPPPMHSPPPLRRASLPMFSATYNPNPTPPLLNPPAHTPPLFTEALEGSSSLGHLDHPGKDPQTLQAETSSLFDYGEKLDYLTSSQQNNNLSYQLQTSYPPSQPQSQAPIPRLAYLTPSPYLAPNPPDSNSTSYLTFGPGRGSHGVLAYTAGGHTYFQSQNTGQILLQPAGHNGGTAAYQSYPWGNILNQPAVVQHPQCHSSYQGSMGPLRDHQQLHSTNTLPPPSFFPQGSHGSFSSMLSSNTQADTTTTSMPTAFPPVSTLRPSHLRVDTAPPKVTVPPPSHIGPASPESPPVPSCVKLEYDSPGEIHSHFHCDFSPIHF